MVSRAFGIVSVFVCVLFCFAFCFLGIWWNGIGMVNGYLLGYFIFCLVFGVVKYGNMEIDDIRGGYTFVLEFGHNRKYVFF